MKLPPTPQPRRLSSSATHSSTEMASPRNECHPTKIMRKLVQEEQEDDRSSCGNSQEGSIACNDNRSQTEGDMEEDELSIHGQFRRTEKKIDQQIHSLYTTGAEVGDAASITYMSEDDESAAHSADLQGLRRELELAAHDISWHVPTTAEVSTQPERRPSYAAKIPKNGSYDTSSTSTTVHNSEDDDDYDNDPKNMDHACDDSVSLKSFVSEQSHLISSRGDEVVGDADHHKEKNDDNSQTHSSLPISVEKSLSLSDSSMSTVVPSEVFMVLPMCTSEKDDEVRIDDDYSFECNDWQEKEKSLQSVVALDREKRTRRSFSVWSWLFIVVTVALSLLSGMMTFTTRPNQIPVDLPSTMSEDFTIDTTPEEKTQLLSQQEQYNVSFLEWMIDTPADTVEVSEGNQEPSDDVDEAVLFGDDFTNSPNAEVPKESRIWSCRALGRHRCPSLEWVESPDQQADSDEAFSLEENGASTAKIPAAGVPKEARPWSCRVLGRHRCPSLASRTA